MIEVQLTAPDSVFGVSWVLCAPGHPTLAAIRRVARQGHDAWFRDANGTVCRVRPLSPRHVWRCYRAGTPRPTSRKSWVEVELQDGERVVGAAGLFGWHPRDDGRAIVKWRFAK